MPPSWWWELTKFGNPGQPSDLSSFAGQHPIPNVAPSQHLAPKAVVHYQVNAGTRPQAGAEFATWIEFHQHLMIPHHILPINLSFVRCCVLHPPTPKKKRNLDSLDARNGAKWDSKAGWKIWFPTCEVWAAQGPTPLATAPAPTMQQWGSGGQAAKHIALEIQQNTRQESPPKVPCPSSFSALVDWTSVATSRPMQIKYALGI